MKENERTVSFACNWGSVPCIAEIYHSQSRGVNPTRCKQYAPSRLLQVLSPTLSFHAAKLEKCSPMQFTRPLRHSPVRTPTQSTLSRTAALFLPLAGVKADLLLTPAEWKYWRLLELSAKVETRLAFVKAANSAMPSIRNGERSRSL